MKYFSLLVAFLVSGVAQSQNLTFKDLTIILSKSNWEGVNQYVAAKGWKYNKSSEGDDDHYSTITWAYRPSSYDEDKAESWLNLHVDYTKPVKVFYQFNSQQSYNSIKAALAAAGLRQIGSDIQDDGLYVTYSSKSYYAQLITSKTEGSSFTKSTVYVLQLKKKNPLEINISGEAPNLAIMTDTAVITPLETVNGMVRENEPDGTYADYNYVNGKLQGVAKLYGTDDKLAGEFTYKNDVLSGPYKLYEEGKMVESGNYVNNKKQGAYRRYENGKVSITGVYVDEIPNGLHTYYYYPDSDDNNLLPTKSTGKIMDGKMNGQWKDFVIFKGKEIPTGYNTYTNDVLNGPAKEVREDSIVFATYKDGELSGPYRLYIDYLTPDGSAYVGDTTKAFLRATGKYKQGLYEGLWKIYDHNKVLREEANYESGLQHGVTRIYYRKEGVMIVASYSQGSLQTETFYHLGTDKLYTGTLRTFSINQTPKEEIGVKDGKRHGISRVYNDEGILEQETNYNQGIMQ